MKRAAVIGGGVGGLSAALHLTARGFHVSLLEKNDVLGGKIAEHQEEGFRFDTGPTLLTMPFVIEELFELFSEEMADFLKVEPISPICRYFYESGEVVNAYSDLRLFANEVSSISRRDAANLEKYFRYSADIYQSTADVFLFKSINELSTLFSVQGLKALLSIAKMDAFRSVHEANSSFFESPKIVQLFDRYATYSGSDPYRAPATLNTIPHVEYTLGSYYIRGGMFRLVEALHHLAVKNGVDIFCGREVKKIYHEGGVARGIEFSDESRYSYDVIVCNADVVHTFENLIDGFPAKKKRLAAMEPSCSGVVFLWGVKREYRKLAHHNIFFAQNYREEFEAIFDRGEVSYDPTVYVSVSAKTDHNHAPVGQENWFVLVNAPYLAGQERDPQYLAQVKRVVLDKLARNGFDFLEQSIVCERVIGPSELLQRSNSNRGSIYGISSNSRSAAFQRQQNRCRELKRLFFAGGSVHPGGGIPLAILSGKIAAELAERHCG